jgi:hypothetical protein
MMPSAREGEPGNNNAECQLAICLVTAAKINAVKPKETDKLADLLRCKTKPDPSSARWHELQRERGRNVLIWSTIPLLLCCPALPSLLPPACCCYSSSSNSEENVLVIQALLPANWQHFSPFHSSKKKYTKILPYVPDSFVRASDRFGGSDGEVSVARGGSVVVVVVLSRRHAQHQESSISRLSESLDKFDIGLSPKKN